MLAYLFWHWPVSTIDRGEYEEKLAAFHQMLGRQSAVFRFDDLPWASQPTYEDWYLVDDFADLGRLNDDAVSGARRQPHDVVAVLADNGTGGLYKVVGQPGEIGRFTAWFGKPSGMKYADLFSRLESALAGQRYQLWQRQMTLGPAKEFCLRSDVELQLPDWIEPLRFASERVV